MAYVPLAVKPRPSRHSFLLVCRFGAPDSVLEAFKRFREDTLRVAEGIPDTSREVSGIPGRECRPLGVD